MNESVTRKCWRSIWRQSNLSSKENAKTNSPQQERLKSHIFGEMTQHVICHIYIPVNKGGKPCERGRIRLGFESFEMNYLSQAKCHLLDCSFLLWMLLINLSLSQYIHSLFVACKQMVTGKRRRASFQGCLWVSPVQCERVVSGALLQDNQIPSSQKPDLLHQPVKVRVRVDSS